MNNEVPRSKIRIFGKRLVAVAFIIAGIAVLTDLSMAPIIESVAAYECRLVISEMINSAVSEQLENEDINYSELVDLTTNSNGEVISVESNVLNINKLKTDISRSIDNHIRFLPSNRVGIPVGTLTGIQLLHGHGFDVGMMIKPVGSGTTRIISEFNSVGLNQTRHRILIEISVTADALIPGFSSEVSVTTSIVAAETIIIGKVPEAYTHVVSYDDDLIGTLQDYGAGI